MTGNLLYDTMNYNLIGGYTMLIYEFLVECREVAIKNGFMAEVKRLSEVIACLTIEQAEKELD